ncbi:DUF3857 domain-containing protein [Bryobacter aggregatus]|uniref:DUF3857 domain-containing protein n=1 Tax=Bryobacter aggregatus TaxID=360054 RepID=UPI0004E19F9E|nr:DUF3857 domain-containing protein [Bryobacter aggregatus]
MILRFLAALFLVSGAIDAQSWEPIPPEQLSLETPKIDPNADAEAIFWQARVRDDVQSQYVNHHVQNYKRIKIYTEQGAKRWGTVELPYYSELNMTLTGIAARTILPDGTITEVKPSSIFDTTMEKNGRSKIKAKSFAFPGVVKGSIIEFKYEEVYSERPFRYVELEFQLEIPAWDIVYFVRPIPASLTAYRMRAYPFNCSPSPWEPVKGVGPQLEGFVSSRLKSVPAFIPEPLSPASNDIRQWMLLYYTEASQDKPDKFWKNSGKMLSENFKRDLRNSGEIKAMAAELTAGKSSVTAKAEALAIFCQTKIGNVSYSADGMTSEIRDHYFKKLYKPEYNANDTLKNKLGTGRDILKLFYSLAQSAGLNPILVRASDASRTSFRPDFLDDFLLRRHLVGFRDGEGISYFDPSNPYLPAGMLHWTDQGQAAVLVEPKEAKLVILPTTPPAQSSVTRTAKLKLDATGAISGTMQYDYSGLTAMKEKLEFEDQSAGSREEAKKRELEKQFPAAVIENVKILNAATPNAPLSLSFSIKMEGYGQRTGKRLFFQPTIFEYGAKPLFSSAKRQYPIAFEHPYSETDSITIEMPEDYQLENASVPGTTKLGQIGEITLTAGVNREQAVLTLNRQLIWGNAGSIFFEPKHYPALKQAWDRIHEINTMTLTLRAK